MMASAASCTLRTVVGVQGRRVAYPIPRPPPQQRPLRASYPRSEPTAPVVPRLDAFHRLYCVSQDPTPSESGVYEELPVGELSEILSRPAAEEAFQFVDVREPWEAETSSLPRFKTLPLGPLLNGARDDDLDATKPTVLLCHHGIRSKTAAQYLLRQGFQRVLNVTGGIDAYSRAVDSSIPRY